MDDDDYTEAEACDEGGGRDVAKCEFCGEEFSDCQCIDSEYFLRKGNLDAQTT